MLNGSAQYGNPYVLPRQRSIPSSAQSLSRFTLSRVRYLEISSTKPLLYIDGRFRVFASNRSGPVSLANIVVIFSWLPSPLSSTSIVTLCFCWYSAQNGLNCVIAGGRQLKKLSVTGSLRAAP